MYTGKDFSVNITLLNVATEDREDLTGLLENYYYERHRAELAKYCDQYGGNCQLFKPYSYYIFGSYDIAILTLINNYTFSQKLLFPKFREEDNKSANDVPNYTYQVITGILSDEADGANDEAQIDLGELYDEYGFVTICNFKLNNKFIVKDGLGFTSGTVDAINSTIAKVKKKVEEELWGIEGQDKEIVKYFILHSFSWFEISVVFFTNQPKVISQILQTLRKLKVKDTGVGTHILHKKAKGVGADNQTIYEDEVNDFANSDVFMDSQSYFGVKHKMTPEEIARLNTVDLHTQVEWQVKPGHYDRFLDKLSNDENGKFKEIFKLGEPKMVFGRSDYVIEEKVDKNFSNNIDLINYLSGGDGSGEEKRDRRNGIFRNIRNIYTRIFFPLNDGIEELKALTDNKKFRDYLDVNDINIGKVDKQLKSLKVSRQTREMTLKLLHIYVNGIHDDVLAIYFLDFFLYVKSLVGLIDGYHSKYQRAVNGDIKVLDPNEHFKVDIVDFEEMLYLVINNMDEGIKLRMLNSYRFEDITEISLGFNSSIQRLISMYNSLANQFGSMIYNGPKQTGYIVLLHYRSTVSNINVINYNVHDLLHPEFIFYSLSKEILNSVGPYLDKKSDGVSISAKKRFDNIEKRVRKILDDNKQPHYSGLEYLLQSGVFDVNYLLNDTLRFVIAANFDVEMFVYWTWAITLKNSSAYDISGTIKEDEFKSVLFRLLFTLKAYGYNAHEILYCPIPQLVSLWRNIYEEMTIEVDSLFDPTYDIYKEIVRPIKKLSSDILCNIYKDIYKGEAGDESPVKSGLTKYIDELEEFDSSSVSSILVRHKYLLGVAGRAIKEGASTGDPMHDMPGDQLSRNNINIEIEGMMLQYLTWIKDKNFGTGSFMTELYTMGKSKLEHTQPYLTGRYINYLNRNLKNGDPLNVLNSFKTPDPETMYYKIDQTGAVFFVSRDKANEYFRERNKILNRVWHICTKCKAGIARIYNQETPQKKEATV